MYNLIEPSHMLLGEKPLAGMYGKFIFIDFCDTFDISSEYEQLSLFQMDRIQILRKEED